MSDVVASIGTTHPWNAAGLGLDILVAKEFGVRNLTVVAAVSAQDAQGLHALEPVSPQMLEAQLAALPMDEVNVLRVGALTGSIHVQIVADFIRSHPNIPAVVDPVFGATLGGTFIDEAAFTTFRNMAANTPSVILTPNLGEAARLLDIDTITRNDFTDAARKLCATVQAVLLKGGHLPGDPVDILAIRLPDGTIATESFQDKRIDRTMRGTGCTLAMALACELARGLSLRDAVESARSFVRARIEASGGGF